MRGWHLGAGEAYKLILAGLAAGFANGLLGAGGGIITVFILSKVMKKQITSKNGVFANALCVMLPLSLISCAIYAFKGHMSVDGFGVFAIPAVAGGAIGGLLLGRLKAAFMRRLFAALVIISGVLLIVR